MHPNTVTDINAFCALPTYIKTVQGEGKRELYVFDRELRDVLQLPEELNCEEFLCLRGCIFEPLETQDSASEELSLVCEAGLYILLLLSEAEEVRPFKSWVLQVVAPTLAEDGLFLLEEEAFCTAPTGYGPTGHGLTHDEIWDESASDMGCAEGLATTFLPELRKSGSVDDGIIIVKDGEPKISAEDFVFAMAKKASRKKKAAGHS